MHALTCAVADPPLELPHQSGSPAKSKNKVLLHMDILMKQKLENKTNKSGRYKPEYQQPQDPQPPF
jgi:hypothetical protein